MKGWPETAERFSSLALFPRYHKEPLPIGGASSLFGRINTDNNINSAIIQQEETNQNPGCLHGPWGRRWWRAEPCSTSGVEADAFPNLAWVLLGSEQLPRRQTRRLAIFIPCCVAMTSHSNSGKRPTKVQVERKRTLLPHSTGGNTVDFFFNSSTLLLPPIVFPSYVRPQLQLMLTLPIALANV